jgi:hypothetical protein
MNPFATQKYKFLMVHLGRGGSSGFDFVHQLRSGAEGAEAGDEHVWAAATLQRITKQNLALPQFHILLWQRFSYENYKIKVKYIIAGVPHMKLKQQLELSYRVLAEAKAHGVQNQAYKPI